MTTQNKCEYCEENKKVQNIEGKLNVLFFEPNFQSRYIMCDMCLKQLIKNGSLTSKDGKCTIRLA